MPQTPDRRALQGPVMESLYRKRVQEEAAVGLLLFRYLLHQDHRVIAVTVIRVFSILRAHYSHHVMIEIVE